MATAAASSHTQKAVKHKPLVKNGLCLVWLDDSANADPDAKDIFFSLFEYVYTFIDIGACLEMVEATESEVPCICVLISGKFGQMVAHDRLQPLQQVKYIYVFCFDIAKHNQWATKCSKVRCVESDFGNILHVMQLDVSNKLPHTPKTEHSDHQQPQEEEKEEVPTPKELERFMDDRNFYEQLALDILLEIPVNDGAEDFKKYCELHTAPVVEGQVLAEQPHFKANVPIKEWYRNDLFFVNLNATDFAQLWTLRWFVRLFYRQLQNEHANFIRDGAQIMCYYGTYLDSDELEAMKHRISNIIIFTQPLQTFAGRDKALHAANHEKTEQKSLRVVFEMNIDNANDQTVPYSNIHDDMILIWFGSRHRIMKIEYIEDKNKLEESYWLIGTSLHSTFEMQPSVETLYKYYRENLLALNDVHRALGRVLMYKGLYWEAEQWLLPNKHYEELAELAIRQNQCERARQYLQNLPEDSHEVNLLRVYVDLLSPGDNVGKARTNLIKINSDATEKIVRAQVNFTLGFLDLIVTQQVDQALAYFIAANETLKKCLPDNHPAIARSFIGVGYAHFTKRNFKDAEQCFQTALRIQQETLPYLHPDIAKARSGLAHCFSIDKQIIGRALQEFEYAYNTLMHAFPHERKTHQEIVLTKADMDKLRKGKELRARNTLLDYI